MGAAFAAALPACAEVFARADAALGFALSRLAAEGPAEALARTENTQPAVLAASIAALTAGRAAGLPPPDFVAGHSLGEYSALVAAGVLTLEDALRAVRLRGRWMQEAVPEGVGAMSAVFFLAPDAVADACREAVAECPGEVACPANFNAPDQTVIAGHARAVRLAGEKATAKGARRIVPLPVSAPFHTPLMAPVAPRMAELLAGVAFTDAAPPVVTNVGAAPESRGAALRSLLVGQVTAPVRWTDVVASLAAQGCDIFVEFGPGAVLSGLVRRQLRGARTFPVSAPAQLEAALQALRA